MTTLTEDLKDVDDRARDQQRRVNRHASLLRLANRWPPFDNRYIVRGILYTDSNEEEPVASSHHEMARKLGKFREPIFQAKPISKRSHSRFCTATRPPGTLGSSSHQP